MRDYLEELKQPDPRSRGITRWWWYGCNVRKDEITKQLDDMLEAQIGGVEIQICYPLEADNQKEGRENLEYCSPAFFEILRFTAEEAKKRGMYMDLTLGSSWPFGGSFVPFDLSAPVVVPITIDVTGPRDFSYDFTTRLSGEIVGCIMGKMEHSKMLPDTIVDLTQKLSKKYLFSWPWGTQLEHLRIPEGNYKIVCFVSQKYREHVLIPARGAAGLVIDHNRKDAARLFFETMGTPIVEHVGKGMIRSFFCDSIEVSGHNWTNIIYEEFEKRRGYSLRPFIYALWGEIDGMTEQIRYDFMKTYAELTVENFFSEMTSWCHEMGSTSRIQAHGTWGDILQAYGAADIPEGETFSTGDRYTVNTIHRRLASSAGNVYHKPIISNESFTWLRFPRFMVTPEHLKAAADAIFLDGMNQIVNHGFSYTRGELEEWPFYASSHICPTNTWWPFYHRIGRYIHRVSHFLQQGQTKAEVAIYLPQNDIWAENPLCDLHMCMKLEERLGSDAIDGIAKAGYWFDYVNDDVICRMDEYDYQILILMETDRLPVDTADAMKRFAERGGKIVCAERLPSKGCGLIRASENAEHVQNVMKELSRQGKILFTEDKMKLPQLLGRVSAPDLAITDGNEDIGYVHKTDGERDIYFISNISKKAYETRLCFRDMNKSFTVLCPLEGKEKKILAYKQGSGICRKPGADLYRKTEKECCAEALTDKAAQTEIALRFDPFESILIIFDQGICEEPYIAEPADTEQYIMDISNRWKLVINGRTIDTGAEPIPWQKYEGLTYYAGQGTYVRSVDLKISGTNPKKVVLEAEHLSACAAVYVNDVYAGDIIKYPYQIEITPFLRDGGNEVRIEAVSLLINRTIDPDYHVWMYEKPVIEEWPYFTGALNADRKRRISSWREKDMIREPVDSGMWGKVFLRIEE